MVKPSQIYRRMAVSFGNRGPKSLGTGRTTLAGPRPSNRRDHRPPRCPGLDARGPTHTPNGPSTTEPSHFEHARRLRPQPLTISVGHVHDAVCGQRRRTRAKIRASIPRDGRLRPRLDGAVKCRQADSLSMRRADISVLQTLFPRGIRRICHGVVLRFMLLRRRLRGYGPNAGGSPRWAIVSSRASSRRRHDLKVPSATRLLPVPRRGGRAGLLGARQNNMPRVFCFGPPTLFTSPLCLAWMKAGRSASFQASSLGQADTGSTSSRSRPTMTDRGPARFATPPRPAPAVRPHSVGGAASV